MQQQHCRQSPSTQEKPFWACLLFTSTALPLQLTTTVDQCRLLLVKLFAATCESACDSIARCCDAQLIKYKCT